MKGLLSMRDKFERIVAEAFKGEKAAQKKLQEAFEVREEKRRDVWHIHYT